MTRGGSGGLHLCRECQQCGVPHRALLRSATGPVRGLGPSPSLCASSRPSPLTPVPSGWPHETRSGKEVACPSRGNRKAPWPVAGPASVLPPEPSAAPGWVAPGSGAVTVLAGRGVRPRPPSACGPPPAAPRTLSPRPEGACQPVTAWVSDCSSGPRLRDTSQPRQAPGAVSSCPLHSPSGWLWAPRALPGSPRLLTRDPGFPACLFVVPGLRGAWGLGLRLEPGTTAPGPQGAHAAWPVVTASAAWPLPVGSVGAWRFFLVHGTATTVTLPGVHTHAHV